jgi:hypothetical protein
VECTFKTVSVAKFGGNVNMAIRSLMEKAIAEETMVNQAIVGTNKG